MMITTEVLLLLLVFLVPTSSAFLCPFPIFLSFPNTLHRRRYADSSTLSSSSGENNDEISEINDKSSGDGNANSTFSTSSTTPRRRGLLFRITGDSSPYDFPIRPVPLTREWPKESAFTASNAWGRMDASNDRLFYLIPRIIYHIDEAAVCALTQHHRRTILPQHEGGDVLDLCSSWVSHYPVEFTQRLRSIRGLGLNPVELVLNDQLTGGYDVFDLNSGEKGATQPRLPYEDGSFDAITCSCSFDYLVRPVEVLQECRRVLRLGGTVVLGFSNRCFGTKATRIWRVSSNRDHVELINGYFQYAGGFGPREAYDITAIDKEGEGREDWFSSMRSFGRRDPMFVVQARRLD